VKDQLFEYAGALNKDPNNTSERSPCNCVTTPGLSRKRIASEEVVLSPPKISESNIINDRCILMQINQPTSDAIISNMKIIACEGAPNNTQID
jgi:hypothetical protein